MRSRALGVTAGVFMASPVIEFQPGTNPLHGTGDGLCFVVTPSLKSSVGLWFVVVVRLHKASTSHMSLSRAGLVAGLCVAAAVTFTVEDRIQEFRRAIARGHPVDMELMQKLEFKNRLVADSYKCVPPPPSRGSGWV